MKENNKEIRRIKLFEILKNNISFDKTINENGRFSAISAYMDKLDENNDGISFTIDTEDEFVEFILTYSEAKILEEAIVYMTNKIDEKMPRV